MAEKSKEHWEIKDIKNKIRIGRLSFLIGLLTVILTVIGYFVDSYKTREQRSWQTHVTSKNEKIKRMTAIAEEFNDLYSSTLNVSVRIETDALWFTLALGEIKESIESSNVSFDKEKLKLIDSVHTKLTGQGVEVQQFSEGIMLQERWRVVKESLTPDFELLFGEEMAKEWKEVSNAAWEILNDTYNIFDDNQSGEDLEEIGRNFQKKLYQKIQEEKNKTI